MNRLARRTVSVLAALAVGVSLAWAASVHDTASPVPSATTDAPVPSSAPCHADVLLELANEEPPC